MRTGLRVTIIAVGIVGLLAALVFVLVATPVGWGLASGLVEDAASDATGLDLAIGALRGNLLSNATLDDLTLAAPDGSPVFTASKIEMHYSLLELLGRRLDVPTLRVEDAELLIVRGRDGKFVGWSALGADPDTTDEDEPGEPWTIDAAVELSNWHVVFADSATGTSIDVTGLDLEATGGPDDFEGAVTGSIRVDHGSLVAPLLGDLSAALEGDGERFAATSLMVRTNVGEIEGDGELVLPAAEDAPPRLDARANASLDLTAAAALAGIEDLSGDLPVSGSLAGPVDALAYRGEVRAGSIDAVGIDVEDLAAMLAGDLDALEIESLSAAVLGAAVEASGVYEFPAGEADAGFTARARIEGLDLARFEATMLEEGPGLAGVVDARVLLGSESASVVDLTGEIEASIGGLSIGDTSLGNVDLTGEAEEGLLSIEGTCCATLVEASAPLAEDGIHELDVYLTAMDLSVPGAVLDLPDLAGSGVVVVSFAVGTDSLSAYASFLDLRYGDLKMGPLFADVVGSRGNYAATLRAFHGAVRGRATLEETERYQLTADVVDFELARVVSDSLREFLELSGSVNARATLEGEIGGAYSVEGLVTDLLVHARGQQMELEAPFVVDVAPDSVHVSEVALDGSMGSFTVAGGFDFEETVDIVARLEALDLEAVAALAPEAFPVTPRGVVDGRFSLRGNVDDPVFEADVDVRQLSVRGLEFNSFTLEAESDRSDLTFTVDGTGPTSGSIVAYGSIPIQADSLSFLSLDPEREFGISFACDNLVLDMGSEFMPNVRGRKTIVANGSGLLVGRTDSLASVNGRGGFDKLKIVFDRVEFTLGAPMNFDLASGEIEVDTLAIDVLKRRVLGDPDGGRIRVAGVVGGDVGSDITITAEDVDTGHLVRSFARGLGPALSGMLDLSATLSGDFTDPRAEFAWAFEKPLIYGVGLDRLEGSGSIADGVLHLGKTELAGGDGTIAASGTITFPGLTPGDSDAATGTDAATDAGAPAAERTTRAGSDEEESPELDLRIVSDGFRLDDLGPLPSDITRLRGKLEVDLSVTGPASLPDVEGRATLTGGRLEGFDLSQAVRDIELDVNLADHVVALERASARMGSGGVSATGFAQLGATSEETVFQLQVSLDSPRLAIHRMFDGVFGGNVSWAGSAARSQIEGTVTVERMDVTYSFGLGDMMKRRPIRIALEEADDPRANVGIDFTVTIEDKINVDSNVAKMEVKGDIHAGGTLQRPELSGTIYADRGSFTYFDHEFELERLSVGFVDPRRRDPYVDLFGTTDAEDREQVRYSVSIEYKGFTDEAVPKLESFPELTSPDIISLLTFGDTFGALVEGGTLGGSSADAFTDVARRAFTNSVYGVAESTLERALNLDTVRFEESTDSDGDLTNTDLTVGKRFGEDFRIDYTMEVGKAEMGKIEFSVRLHNYIWVGTVADPTGNHGVNLSLRVPFK